MAPLRVGDLTTSTKDLRLCLEEEEDQEFFKEETAKFQAPIRATIAPKEEEDSESFATEGLEVGHKDANRFRGDHKFESALTKLRNTKMSRKTTNGSMQKNLDRIRRKTKFAATKSSHKEEGSSIKHVVSDWSTQPASNGFLNLQTRVERETRERHYREGGVETHLSLQQWSGELP